MYHSFLIHLLPWLSYCKWCCNEHWGICVSFNSGFLGVFAQQWDCWVYGSSIYSFLRNLHTVLHSGYTSLHSHQRCKSVLFFSTPPPAFNFCRLFHGNHSDQHGMYPTVVLIWISLIMNDVEHLFMCLLVICMSSLEKCLFNSLAHFLIESFIFLELSCRCACIFLRLVVCQLLHLVLFSPIQKAVFSPCLYFPLLCRSFTFNFN